VVLTFGNISLHPVGTTFMLAKPDFEHKTQPIEISKVYLDPQNL